MNYNDFPIMNDEDYLKLNTLYSQPQTDKHRLMFDLCTKLNQCRNMCFFITDNHNKKIKDSLLGASKTLTKLFNNFSSTFNIQPSNNQITEGNIFLFMKLLNSTIKLLQSWAEIEKKEYYQKLISNSSLEILEILDQLFGALLTSNISFFKHM